MTRTTRSTLTLLALSLLMVGSGTQALAADYVVGAVSPNGTAYLIKEFKLTGGSTITGVAFTSNEKTTAFPKVLVLQGPATRISDATVLAEITGAEPTDGHRVTATCSALSIAANQVIYVAVSLPASDGVKGVGDGVGILATQLAQPNGSYFASGVDGYFGAMDVEYEIELIYEVGKAGAPSAAEEAQIPRVASASVRPNPFNPSVTIEFAVPRVAEVHVKIYDVAGRHVRTLVNEEFEPGVYRREWAATSVATGLYFAKLRIGQAVFTRKLVLTK